MERPDCGTCRYQIQLVEIEGQVEQKGVGSLCLRLSTTGITKGSKIEVMSCTITFLGMWRGSIHRSTFIIRIRYPLASPHCDCILQ
jgi:hypothetical protein